MYKNEFELKIKQKHIFDSVFFFGLSVYSFEYYASFMINSLPHANGDSIKDSIRVVYFDDYDFKEAKDYLSHISLFSSTNILIIKTISKIDTKELKELIEITTKLDNSFLILQQYPNNDEIAYSKISSSMQMQFSKFKDKAGFVRFFKPNLKDSLELIKAKTDESNLKISPQLIKDLYMNNSENLEFCISDIDKLLIYDDEITSQNLEDIKSPTSEINIDDFIYKVLEKKEIAKDYQYLCLHGLKEIEFLAKFANFVQSLILFNIYIKENGFFDSKEILGYKLPKQIEEKRAKVSILFNMQKYELILESILETDIKIKGAVKIDKKAYLFSKILQIQLIL